MSLRVIQPGVLSSLQDGGRVGQMRQGLTQGGPMDFEAYHYCMRLLCNPVNCSAIELSVGGAQFEVNADTFICVTGASVPLQINEESAALWQVHPVRAGDVISIGHAVNGCRSYLGVAEGFNIAPSFGSTSTVVREGIGGLNGGALQTGDELPYSSIRQRKLLCLPQKDIPKYQNTLTVRVIPGYQQALFSRQEQRKFFGGPYTITHQSNRMGYRLEGAAINCTNNNLLSEGICYGAIQIPGDGQPIILLNDRQTIGGYPKIGTALSLDTARLAQLTAGATVHFTPISLHTARRALELSQRFLLSKPLRENQP